MTDAILFSYIYIVDTLYLCEKWCIPFCDETNDALKKNFSGLYWVAYGSRWHRWTPNGIRRKKLFRVVQANESHLFVRKMKLAQLQCIILISVACKCKTITERRINADIFQLNVNERNRERESGRDFLDLHKMF